MEIYEDELTNENNNPTRAEACESDIQKISKLTQSKPGDPNSVQGIKCKKMKTER